MDTLLPVAIWPEGPLLFCSFFDRISILVEFVLSKVDTVENIITVSIPTAIPSYSFSGAAINTNGDFECPPIFGAFSDSSLSYGNITNWQWDFGNGNQSSLQNPSNTYVETGTYTLNFSITDQYGCTDDTTLIDFLTIGGPTGTPDWIQNSAICAQGAQFIIINPQGVDSIIWEMGDGTMIYDSIDFTYNYDQPGTYSPSVTLLDNNGCEINYNLSSISVTDDGLNASFTASPNPADNDEIITFTDQSSSQSSTIISWVWDLIDTLIYSPNNSSQTHSYAISGNYNVVLTITDSQGCQDDYMLTIIVNDPEIWVPNVFTPNGDYANDEFTLPFEAFKFFNIIITNRWGNVVFEKTNSTGVLLWDGYDLGGEKCKEGVYFYQLNGEMLGGTLIDQHGFVTLIDPK